MTPEREAGQTMVMRRVGISFCVVCLASFLAGCGGAGARHTYIAKPTVNGVPIGAYVTIVSPVAFPQSLLDTEKKGGAIFVQHAVGPEVCSFSKRIEGMKGKDAFLNGKSVTLKVNGSNLRVTSLVCSTLKKQAFNPAPSGLQPASP
jgi:hypothetical protein